MGQPNLPGCCGAAVAKWRLLVPLEAPWEKEAFTPIPQVSPQIRQWVSLYLHYLFSQRGPPFGSHSPTWKSRFASKGCPQSHSAPCLPPQDLPSCPTMNQQNTDSCRSLISHGHCVAASGWCADVAPRQAVSPYCPLWTRHF